MKCGRFRGTRRVWLSSAVVVIGLIALAAILYGRFGRTSHDLIGGGIVANPFAAPDFLLTDQFDHPQRLSTFQGRPIALTFVYTSCPDVCPLIAANMHAAHQRLGSDAKKVVMLAVTVDPERDTVPRVRLFSEEHQLMDEWFFLTGSRPQLEAVWKVYGIYAQAVDAGGHPVTPAAAATTSLSPAAVEHEAPVYLVDKNLKVRALLPTDFTAADLATDLKILLDE